MERYAAVKENLAQNQYTWLITGVAGFIGSKLGEEFLRDKKNKVYGIDNINSYYSIKLKNLRLKKLKKKKILNFINLI